MLKGHDTMVTHMDFSTIDPQDQASKYLMSNSADHVIKYWEFTKEKELSPSDAKDVRWSTHNCIYSWPVVSAWRLAAHQPSGEGGDMREIEAVDVSGDRSTLIVGDDGGQVRLMSYPCVTLHPHNIAYRKYPGHASHIIQTKFTPRSKFAITAGGGDRTVIQYEYYHGGNKSAASGSK